MSELTVEEVRAEVKAWLAENWDPKLTVGEWWERLANSGYAAPTFPEDCFGKGWSRAQANAVNDEIRDAGAIGPPSGLGYALAAPTIARHGTREQKDTDLWRILAG